jgi:hypothetical protein
MVRSVHERSGPARLVLVDLVCCLLGYTTLQPMHVLGDGKDKVGASASQFLALFLIGREHHLVRSSKSTYLINLDGVHKLHNSNNWR